MNTELIILLDNLMKSQDYFNGIVQDDFANASEYKEAEKDIEVKTSLLIEWWRIHRP